MANHSQAKAGHPVNVPAFDLDGDDRDWRIGISDKKMLPLCWLKGNAVDRDAEVLAAGKGIAKSGRLIRPPNVVCLAIDVDMQETLDSHQNFLDKHRILVLKTNLSSHIWRSYPIAGLPNVGETHTELPVPEQIIGGKLIAFSDDALPLQQSNVSHRIYTFPTSPGL